MATKQKRTRSIDRFSYCGRLSVNIKNGNLKCEMEEIHRILANINVSI